MPQADPPLPHPLTIAGVVAAAAARFGAAPALIERNRTWSFAELYAEARAAASALLARGLKAGDVVAIWAPNRSEWIFAALGAQLIGVAVTPLNTRLKGREAADIIRRSGAKLLFSVGWFLGVDYLALLDKEPLPALQGRILFDSAREQHLGWPAFVATGAGPGDPAVDRTLAERTPDEICDIMFTSGTTGAPKGVRSAHGQTVRAFLAWTEACGLREGDRYLIVNPFFHAFGYKAGWLSCLLRGATILPTLTFDADDVGRRIAADKITVLPGPPTLFQSLLAVEAHKRFDLSSLRLSVTGAATVPPALIGRMKTDLGFDQVVTGYGLTESSGVVTMCRADDPAERVAATCGVAIPGVEIRCAGPDGTSVPTGEPGEVLVRGFNVMQGYLDDPAATAEAIDGEGWLHTGDVGVLDAEGYLRITDRMKDIFICGGFNCYPAEIEKILADHPAIRAVAVVGLPDERMGEVGAAFVVLEPGARDGAAEIVAWARRNMANYKVPRSVRIVEALPLNASGKVLKTALRDLAEPA